MNTTSEQPYEKCLQELREAIQSRYPLIFLRSSEETRAIRCASDAHDLCFDSKGSTEGELFRWSTTGLKQRVIEQGNSARKKWQNLQNTTPSNNSNSPIVDTLDALQNQLEQCVSKTSEQQHTYILPDWPFLIPVDNHLISRRLKELLLDIESRSPRPRMTLIVIGAEWSIPTILRDSIHIVDLPLPTGKELYDKVFSGVSKNFGIPDDEAHKLSEQAQGMSLNAATQAAKLANTRELWSDFRATGKLFLEVKKQEIRKTGVLEYYSPQGQGLSDVGGLENVKKWVGSRKEYFEKDDDPKMRPRAILLEGFPGCGKTFIARAIAQEWCIPQINFEISRLQGRYVGDSESNTFQALRAIEASAPNILFMDEIEKAFAGIGGDSSGVTTRQFGTFLSWLNDHEYPILFIATSNDRNKLPAELFRAGRFDETFIVMPPTTIERKEIFQKQIRAYGLESPEEEILDNLVNLSRGYSGAEISKLVKEAKYMNQSNPSFEDWKRAKSQVIPQYRSSNMKELLKKYQSLIEDGSGKSASLEEEGFFDSIVL